MSLRESTEVSDVNAPKQFPVGEAAHRLRADPEALSDSASLKDFGSTSVTRFCVLLTPTSTSF